MRAAEDGEEGGFPLAVASAPRSLSGVWGSISPFCSRDFASAAAKAALIASASAADASTRDSTPPLPILT